MPGLPTRLTSALTAQRLQNRLGKRRIRRRRPRRIPAVLTQLPLQLSILGPHVSDLSLQPLDQLSLPLDKSSKPLIGQTPITKHHNMIDKPEERSTRHAARRLTSYVKNAVIKQDLADEFGPAYHDRF
jgi:hypothetical protein